MLSRKQFVLFVLSSTMSQGPLKPLSSLVMLFTGMIGNAVPGWLITYFHFLSASNNKSMHFRSPLSMEMWAQYTGWLGLTKIKVVFFSKSVKCSCNLLLWETFACKRKWLNSPWFWNLDPLFHPQRHNRRYVDEIGLPRESRRAIFGREPWEQKLLEIPFPQH